MNIDLFKAELSPTVLTAEDLGKLLEAAETLESYIKSARKEAERRLDSGEEVIGWQLVQTSGRMKVIDAAKAQHQLQPVIQPSQFIEACSPKVGDLVKAIRDNEGCTLDEAKDILADYLKENLQSSNEDGSRQKLERIPKQIAVKDARDPSQNPDWIEKLNEGRPAPNLGKTI